MSFTQSPPQLGNQYLDDRALRSYLMRVLPAPVMREVEVLLTELGALAGGELYQLQQADRLSEPRLSQWDAWGNRRDEIELTRVWQAAEPLAVKYGLTAIPYERRYAQHSRIVQFALVYLFGPSTDFYGCPLAMTDGAAKTLVESGNRSLIDHALPHLTARDPREFWTSGQWMTESTGGSDVGLAETLARKDAGGQWRLYGRKWFTSAATSQVALTLARPEGNPAGGRGLALFFLETRDTAGALRNIELHRLKEKLGTRKLPTAELTLNGTPAQLVLGENEGVRSIAPMLNITRTWNSITAASLMRRGLALARDYARRRYAFGAQLADKPLHVDTLAGLQAETEAALHLSFALAELLGAEEAGTLDPQQHDLLRLLTPIVKLTTAKQAVAVASEILECFGGAGYVEDTGLPALLRDTQVLPIWEGTTNVLALDTLRALAQAGWEQFAGAIENSVTSARHPRLLALAQDLRATLTRAQDWITGSAAEGAEAGARRFALTLGRTLAAALLLRHAQWSLDVEHDARSLACALRFAQHGFSLVSSAEQYGSRSVALDETLLAEDAGRI